MDSIAGRKRGFSLIELLVVVAVILVVGAMALPTFVTSIGNLRLRSSASSLAALLQNMRMQAIREDRNFTALQGAGSCLGGGPPGAVFFWADLNQPAGNGTCDRNEPSYQLPSSMTFSPAGAPPPDSMQLGVTPISAGFNPAFNPRGLPCVMAGLTCNNIVGGNQVAYAYYIQNNTMLGGTGWAAVSISPGGRVRAWLWSGSSWQ